MNIRNLFCVVFVSLTLISSAQQSLAVSAVPAKVSEAVTMHFPSATGVVWDMNQGYYEAVFTQNGTRNRLVIDPKGQLIHSSVQIPSSALPAAALTYLQGMTVTDAEKLTMMNNSLHYEAIVGTRDILFNANGNYIRDSHSVIKQ